MCDNNNQTTLGSRIAALRKGAGYTQEQLAEQLGVTFQAVSKWENDISCPDVLLLPRLAAIFNISMDALFGLTDTPPCPAQPAPQPEELPRTQPAADGQPAFTWDDIVRPDGPVRVQAQLPWQDDDTLYAVVFQGHTLLRAQQVLRRAEELQQLRLVLDADVGSVQGYFDVEIHGSVDGTVTAGQNAACESVCGNVTAGGDVTCGDIDGDVRAGRDLTAGAVCGNISAGNAVNCTGVDGDIDAGYSVTCVNVTGDVEAGSSVTCGDVYGDIDAGNWVQCGNVVGDIDAGTGVQCGNVDGDIDAGGSVSCMAVNGDIDAGGDVHFCADPPQAAADGADALQGESVPPAWQQDTSGLQDKPGKKKKGFQWRIKL